MNEIDDVRYNIYIDDDDRFVYDDDYSKSIKIEEERTGIISIGVLLIIFIYIFILCIYFVRQKYYNDEVDVNTITIDLNRFIDRDRNRTRNTITESTINELGYMKEIVNENIVLYFNKECSICYCNIEEGDTIFILNNCLHLFHKDCIVQWFTREIRCPLCNNMNFRIQNEDMEVENGDNVNTDNNDNNVQIVEINN